MTKTLKRRFIIFTMTAVTCLLVFIVLAIILFAAARGAAKKAAKAAEAEAAAEEEAVVSVDCEEVAEAEGEESCGYVCIFSGYVKDIKKMSKEIADKVKAKLPGEISAVVTVQVFEAK